MCRQGDRRMISPGAIDSSPLFVLPGWPITPMISPRLNFECTSAKACWPLWLLMLHITWSLFPSLFKS